MRTSIRSALTLALVVGVTAMPAHAQGPDSPRSRLLMDYGWTFIRGDVPEAREIGFDDSAWRTLDLPHDWSIEGPYDSVAATTGRGGYLPTGIGWYRRVFTAPEGSPGDRVRLEFDGVYQKSDVWVNGAHLGHRPNGYVGFHYDITPHLVPGENVVAVRVDNSDQPNSRWYSGSGIYRHVWLTTTGPVHLTRWGTRITTPEVTSQRTLVEVGSTVANRGPAVQDGRAVLRILGPAGEEVARTVAPFSLEAGSRQELRVVLAVVEPALWSPDTPHLYTLETSLLDREGDRLDRVETVFGIRTATFHPDRGFLLNGEPVKLRGVNLHHDGGPVGAAVPVTVWERRLRLLREMGVNAIRTAHNPPAPEFLDLCDRLGFLVMNEAFDEWTHGKVEFGYHRHFDEWAEQDLRDFMMRDRNHPSVVLWSLGNEIGEQHAPGGHEVLARLLRVAKSVDDTRPVTTGNDHIHADDGATTEAFMELLDVVGYNYVDRWHERRELYNEADRHAHPGWRFVGTESGSVRGTRGEYSLGDDPDRVQPDYTTGMIRAAELWKFVSLHDYFAGDFMWTGIDYLGESRWPRKSSTSGVLDLVGFPDDGFHFYRSQWTEEPMIHLFPHWNWQGREGQFIPVLAYTNVDAVELYLNGRFVGEKRVAFPRQGTSGCWNCYDEPRVRPTTADLHLQWDVPWEPGVLQAVGRRDGEVVVLEEVFTAGDPAALRVRVDRDTLRAGEREVAHVEVAVVDAQGTVVPDADLPIRFAVEGAARFLAAGNGNPEDHSSYREPERNAFHGLALAMVQSTDGTGSTTVTVEAEGLPPVTVEIQVVEGDPPPRVPVVGTGALDGPVPDSPVRVGSSP